MEDLRIRLLVLEYLKLKKLKEKALIGTIAHSFSFYHRSQVFFGQTSTLFHVYQSDKHTSIKWNKNIVGHVQESVWSVWNVSGVSNECWCLCQIQTNHLIGTVPAS